nr:hypothetical protein Iba_chr10dCG3760 [Ipomoea batatas]
MSSRAARSPMFESTARLRRFFAVSMGFFYFGQKSIKVRQGGLIPLAITSGNILRRHASEPSILNCLHLINKRIVFSTSVAEDEAINWTRVCIVAEIHLENLSPASNDATKVLVCSKLPTSGTEISSCGIGSCI